MECLFCKIAKKEIPSEIIYEDEKILAFKDIKPVAPIHILIIPKKHIPSVAHAGIEDKALLGELILVVQKIAREQGIAKKGYRLSFNVGKDAGQVVEHLHLHLMGGEKLPFP